MRAVIVALVLLLASPAAAGGWEFDAGIVRSWVFYPVNTAPRDTLGNLLDVTSASPPAIWVHPVTTEPHYIEPGPNATLVGQHGIYGGGPYENYPYRSAICETLSGSNPGGWGVTESAGDGSAAVDCSSAVDGTPVKAFGTDSVKMVLTGTTSYAQVLTNTCLTDGIGSDLYMSARIMCASGVCDSRIKIVEYGAADCSGGAIATTTIYQGNPGTSWIRKGDVFNSWDGACLGWRMLLQEAGNNGVVSYWDMPAALSASTPSDAWCGVDANASAVCSLVGITTTPPEHMSAWTFDATVRSPIDGAVATPVRYILVVPGTAGNNNKISLSWASDTLTCTVYDHSGAAKTSTVAAAGNADTDYSVKMSKSTDGRVECCWDGTCDATPATGAITDGIGSEMIFGSDGTTGGEIWIDCGEDEDRCKLRRGVR